MKASGKADGDYRSKDSKDGRTPTVSFDYKSCGQAAKQYDNVQSVIIRDNLSKHNT